MRIHADFSQTVIVSPSDYTWVKSPGGEVTRMMLDRIGEEKARATSLVEFAPHSKFPSHSHPLGEELLVLSGVFTENDDQHYPAGWYMRNPHHSVHHVSSEEGCLIFVKLRQMTEHELEPVRIDTSNPVNWNTIQHREICRLFKNDHEDTYLQKFKFGQNFKVGHENGFELLIVNGSLMCKQTIYPAGTWIRLPANVFMQLTTHSEDTITYIKQGHLAHAIQVWDTKD